MTTFAKDRDLAHFAAIAAAEETAEDDRIARATQTAPGERMLAGIHMGMQLPVTPELLAEIDARTDGQMELARRRLALGLTSTPRT